MYLFRLFSPVLVISLALSYGTGAYAGTIVRFGFLVGTDNRTLFIELEDAAAPNTVENFLNYVNTTRYNLSLLHRSTNASTGITVLQGGGFQYIPFRGNVDPVSNPTTMAVTPITADDPIVNEFSLSNLRGTLSMAKLGGDPDSATSQWFINVTDNLGLDPPNNGGFTVFGKVLAGGLEVIDEISAIPTFSELFVVGDPIFGNFAELPLVDPNFSTGVGVGNVIELLNASVFTPASGVSLLPTEGLSFGEASDTGTIVKEINVVSDGSTTFTIGAITITGADAPAFSQTNDCGTLTTTEIICTITITLVTTAGTEHSATLTVESDDPGSPASVPLTKGDQEFDGITDTVEDGAPNSGDGNGDGSPDSTQANVASLRDVSGQYTTLVSSETTFRLTQVQQVPNPSPGDAPELLFTRGFFSFQLDGLTAGSAAQVTMIFPSSYRPTAYQMFGPTPDNTTPHWYDFVFNATTGAQFFYDALVPGLPNPVTLVVLNFVDGQRGDSDLTKNGIIQDPGGPSTAAVAAGGGGGGGCSLFNSATTARANLDWMLLLGFLVLTAVVRQARVIRK